MRHEDATDAINTVRKWFGSRKGEDVDAKVANLISAVLEAKQLSDWLHIHGSSHGEDSQPESVDLLWAIVRACDASAIRQAIDEAQKYADEINARANSSDPNPGLTLA